MQLKKKELRRKFSDKDDDKKIKNKESTLEARGSESIGRNDI